MDDNKPTPASRWKTRDPRWRPGESGNPKGRPPKDWTLAEILRRKLEATTWRRVGGSRQALSKRERLVDKLIDLAIRGNIRAFRLIFEYVDGRAPLLIDKRVQASIVQSPEYGQLRALLLQLAARHPQVKRDIVAYLTGGGDPRDGGNGTGALIVGSTIDDAGSGGGDGSALRTGSGAILPAGDGVDAGPLAEEGTQ